jgi:hypothetical protein
MGEKVLLRLPAVVVVVVDMTRKVGVTRLHLSLDPLFVRHAQHPIQLILTSSITITIIITDTHPHPNNIHPKIPFCLLHRVHPIPLPTSIPTRAFAVLPREVQRL